MQVDGHVTYVTLPYIFCYAWLTCYNYCMSIPRTTVHIFLPSSLLMPAYCHLVTLGAHAQRGLVCLSVCLLSHISPLECLFVLKILSHTARATKVKNLWGFLWNRYVAEIHRAFPTLYGCSNIPRTFSMAEPSKGPQKANSRLNSTWNTTRCKIVFSV